MQLRYLLLFCLALFPSLSQSQETLRVKVFDAESKRAEEGAVVAVKNPTRSQALPSAGSTDSNGVALLSIASFPCLLEVSSLGTEPFRITLSQMPPGKELQVPLTKRYSTLSETVVTGVAQPVRLQDAMARYRVINKAQMQALGAVTLADVMPYQINTTLSNDGILGANLNMQGMKGDKVKILIDGLPVNGRENGNIDLGQLNLNNIERVEMVQGPMSVVYGSDALGGVINLISKQQRKGAELSAGFNYESIGKYNADVMGSVRFLKRHMVSLGGGRNFFTGWYDLDTGDYRRRLLWKPKEQYFGNFAYNYAAPSGFRLQLASDFLSEKVTNLGKANVTPYYANAQDDYYKVRRSVNRLTLGGKLGAKGVWQMGNGLSLYHRNRDILIKDLVTLKEVAAPPDNGQDTSDYTDLNSRGSYSNSFGKLEYVAGYDLALQYGKSTKLDASHSMSDYALFTTVAYSFIKGQLRTEAGLRGSRNSRFNTPLIPSFSVLYRPKDNLQIRASYGKGFRAPSLKEMYLQFVDNNHNIVGSDKLKAEEGDHLQASASYQFRMPAKTMAQLVFTGYYNNNRNLITLTPIDPANPNSIDYTYSNISRQRNIILNAQAEGEWNNLHLTASYSINHTYAQQGVNEEYDVQDVLVSASYYWKKPALSITAFYRFSGENPVFVETAGGDATYAGKTPSYSMMDLSLTRKFWKNRLALTAGVHNIFDVQQLRPNLGTVPSTPSGGHSSGNGATNLLPRRFFSTLRFNLYQ